MQYRMLLALLLTLFQPMAHALDIEPGPVKWQLAARQGQLSLSDAADLVQRRTGVVVP